MNGTPASGREPGWIGHLRVIHHGSELVRIDLPSREFLIGRKPGNDLQIDSLAVSGKHAKIIPAGGEVIVEDLGSRNGVWVEGRKVRHHRLRPGDVFRIARYRFLFGISRLERTPPWPCAGLAENPRNGLVPQLKVEGHQGHAPRTIVLSREIVRLGKAGRTVIALVDQGWRVVLRHEGGDPPKVNGIIPPSSVVPLRDRDRVVIDSVEFVFFYGPPAGEKTSP